jgi:hypothetical protein
MLRASMKPSSMARCSSWAASEGEGASSAMAASTSPTALQGAVSARSKSRLLCSRCRACSSMASRAWGSWGWRGRAGRGRAGAGLGYAALAIGQQLAKPHVSLVRGIWCECGGMHADRWDCCGRWCTLGSRWADTHLGELADRLQPHPPVVQQPGQVIACSSRSRGGSQPLRGPAPLAPRHAATRPAQPCSSAASCCSCTGRPGRSSSIADTRRWRSR